MLGARHREHHDPRLGQAGRQLAHQGHAVHAGQADVNEEHVRAHLRRQHQCLLRARRLRHEFDIGGLERLAHRHPDEGVVIDEHDTQGPMKRRVLHGAIALTCALASASGTKRLTRVPPCGTDSMRSSPPMRAARSRMLTRPKAF
jgi:hypothetical protein